MATTTCTAKTARSGPVSSQMRSNARQVPVSTIKYSREELLQLNSKEYAKTLKHQELLEALEIGKINEKIYLDEMKRRKKQKQIKREARKAAEKKIEVTTEYKSNVGHQFTITEEKSELSQQVLLTPLKKNDLITLLAHKTYGPWWTKKINEIVRTKSDEEVQKKLNQFAKSLYSKGTVEYWEDLIWGSRRRRDAFVALMDAPMPEEDEIAECQCAFEEPPLEMSENLIPPAEPEEEEASETVSELSDFWFDSDSDWETDNEITYIGYSEEDMIFEVDSEMFVHGPTTEYQEIFCHEHQDWHDIICSIAAFDYILSHTCVSGWCEGCAYSHDCIFSLIRQNPEEDIPETQMDNEPVLEEAASLAGSSNVTFVEERETDSDQTHVNSNVSTQDPHQNMAERSWNSTSQVLSREIIVAHDTWGETTAREFLSLGLPKCMVDSSNFIKRQLEVFAFLRAGVEIRIQFNGNRFALGSILFAVLPPMFEEDKNNYDWRQSFNFPHVRIDASASNVGVLRVPFTHILSHFPQMKNSLESDSICTLGRLVGYVINPLNVTEGSVNNLSFTIYCKFVAPELHQTTWPISEFSYSDGIITQKGGDGEGLWKKIIGNGLGTALGAILNHMTGGLAAGIGNVLKGLIFDYPHDPMPPEHFVNKAIGPVCYGAGVDHSIRLSLCPVSQTETTPALLGSTDGDFNLKTLLSIPSLLDIFNWRTEDSPGTLLFRMPVCPTYIPAFRRQGVTNKTSEYVPTMLAYVSRAFCFWRGTIILKFQVIKTEFNNGRLLITYTPHVNSKQLPPDQVITNLDVYNQANAVVVDVEEQKEFEIVLPYMSPKPWLRCDALRLERSFSDQPTLNVVMSYLAESFCGYLSVYVLSKQTAPDNVPATCPINLHIQGGNDFELAYPCTLAPLNITSFGLGSFGSYQEYPWALDTDPLDVYDVDFTNKDWITAAYFDGWKLFEAGKIEATQSNEWFRCRPVQYIGTTDPEVLEWCYRASIIAKYTDNDEGVTNVQTRYMSLLPMYNTRAQRDSRVAAAEEEIAEAQILEEYTTNRQKAPLSIIATCGQTSAEVAPSTVSENAMNLQTILRRFYCIYNSVPLYNLSGYTVVALPVNPSFTPVPRAPITTHKGTFFGEAVPTNQIAWFTKLFTYWRGSMRYKITLDTSMFDVVVVHVPTEFSEFKVTSGVHESFIPRIMSYAGTVQVAHLAGAIEVSVPYASTYEQLFVDVHNKYFNALCQNGTLYIMFRNKGVVPVDVFKPLTFQIYMATDEDFVMNVLKAPPIIEEPQMIFGYCQGEGTAQNLSEPEGVRNLGNKSQKLPLPTSTGFNKITAAGRPQYCEPKNPPETRVISTEEVPEAQIFDDIKVAAKEITAVVKEGGIQRAIQSVEHASTAVHSVIQDGNLKETLQSLNCSSRKIEEMLKAATSTASPSVNASIIAKYALLASEVVLCGAFVNQLFKCLNEPSLPNFITLAIELGAIIGLSISEALQSMLVSVIDWAINLKMPEPNQAQVLDDVTLEENKNIVCTAVAVIGTILYAYIFNVIPSPEKIKAAIQSWFESDSEAQAGFPASLKNAHFAMLGITALEKVYNKIMDWVQRFILWYLDQENPEVVVARASEEIRERVLFVVKELDELDYEPNFIASLQDPLVHNRYYKLQNEIFELTQKCTTSKVDQKIVILLTECRRRAQNLLRRLEKERPSATTRYEPFVICLYGKEAGTGKTRISQKFFDMAKEIMDLSPHNLVYSKNIKDQYWSGYTNQPIVFWDEFAQAKDADKEAIPEFIALVGDKPTTVNMAALEDKGRAFTSQCIIKTTNDAYVNFNSIRCSEAYLRRRHVVIEMKFRDGFDGPRMMRARNDEFPNWEHCQFNILEPLREHAIREDVPLAEVLEYTRELMTRHHLNQQAKLAQYQNQELPRGIVPIDPEPEALEELEMRIADEAVVYNAAPEPGAIQFGEIADIEQFFDPEVQVGPELDGLWGKFFKVLPNLPPEDALVCDLWSCTLQSMTARDLKTTWERARTATKATSQRLTSIAKRIFDSLAQRVIDFWNNNPRLCKVLGILTLLTGVGMIMHFRKNNVAEVYESGPTRGQKYRVIPEGSYESGPARARRMHVIAEGSDDIPTMEVGNTVKQRLYPIKWLPNSSVSGKLNAFHIKGHLILVPFHFFSHAKEGDRFILQHRVNPVEIEFQPSKLRRLQEKDWVIYDCGPRLNPGKDMSKFFISANQLGNVSKTKCALYHRNNEDGDIERLAGICEPRREFKYNDPRYGDTYVQDGWKHNIDTQSGHCGSLLLAINPRIHAPGKVLGIHVSGFRTKAEGYAVLITKEQLSTVLSMCEAQCGAPPVPECVKIGVYPTMHVIPDGDFTIVGEMPKTMAPAQPQKTSLIKTPFYDRVCQELGPPPRMPAHLKPFVNAQGERVSPLKKAIIKYGYQTNPFPAKNIRKVINYLANYFRQKLTYHTGKRIFSIPEAVNGLPGVEFAERMNMKSSPGWPYQVEQKVGGKWHMFDEEGNIIDETLKQRLAQRTEAAKKLERVESVWRDCLKDELRPMSKIDAGKTRLFTIAPVDFTILTRQYFFDFVMAFYGAQGDNFFSAVGINPESAEWTRLYKYLAEINTNVVAGDYECFDGKEMPEIIWAVLELVNQWYDDSPENQNVRKVIFEEIIHTMQLCENTVYMTHQGNPSGNPLTTIINTIVNFFLILLAWLELCPDKTLDDFFRYVRFIGYGDDNLIAIAQHLLSVFNQNTISECLAKRNIIYTSEVKDGNQVPDSRPLTEVAFLKRGFRIRDDDFGHQFILPTMSIETLNSYFYYVRDSVNIEEQIRENQRSALLFAAFHGRQFYNQYLSNWQKYMTDEGLTPLFISFEEQVDIFHYNAGMIEKKSIGFDQTPGCVTEGMQGFMKVTNSKPVRLVGGVIEAPLYYLASMLGIMKKDRKEEPTDDRWAIAIPSGEGKSTLAKNYPWLFVDHDELLLPVFKNSKKFSWKPEIARQYDFPKQDRRVLLVHHPSNTNRRLVGSFITPFPSFIRMNCIQRLQLNKPIKMNMNDRNALLVQLCSLLEPSLVDKRPRSELTAYTHGTSCLNQPDAPLHSGEYATPL